MFSGPPSTASFVERELMDPHNVMESGSILNGLRDQSLDTTLDFLKQPVDMGTSIMAVAYDGGVIVGADSRTSTGVDERIYVCRSGSAADTQAVSDYVTHYLNQHR